MARSSTSFRPGNRLGKPNFQPGNKLGMRHGAQTTDALALRMPEVLARIEAEIEGVPYHARPDAAVLRRYCRLVAQAELYEEWFDTTGGFIEADGGARKGHGTYLQIVDRIEKFARLNGLGALARAQTIQATSAGRRDMAEVQGRYERMRAKQRLALVN